jgi:CDP-diacylglycerol--glycerol-3-phosphate 3-phosphatidyltransferase
VDALAFIGGRGWDLAYIASFTALFTVPFVVYLILLARGTVHLPMGRNKRGGAGRRLFGPLFIGYYYWMMGPLFRLTIRTSLTPNQVTMAALVGALLSAVAIGTGHFALASALVIGGSSLDMIDGELARAKHLGTSGGAFLDSTIDRVCDGVIFSGCVVYYAGTAIMYVALTALVMSFTVSYTRSRAESLGLSSPEGLMQRAERIVILGIALAFSPIVAHHVEGFVAHPFYVVTAGALCIIAALNTITAVARILATMERLKESSSGIGAAPAPLEAQPENLREENAALGVPSLVPQAGPSIH